MMNKPPEIEPLPFTPADMDFVKASEQIHRSRQTHPEYGPAYSTAPVGDLERLQREAFEKWVRGGDLPK